VTTVASGNLIEEQRMAGTRRTVERYAALGWDFPIVDVHTHSHYTKSIRGLTGYGWTVPFDGSTEELIQHMNWAGVAKAVLHAASFQPAGYGPWADGGYSLSRVIALAEAQRTNDQIAACVRKFPDRLIGFARIPPTGTKADVAEVERAVKDLGLRGIGHSNTGRGRGKNPYPILEKAQELGIPVEGLQPDDLDVLAPAFPSVTFCTSCFLLTELHKPDAVARFCEVVSRNKNILVDTAVTLAYQPREALKLMREIGFDRFVFATDFPVVGYTIDHYISIFERHSLYIEEIPKEDARKLFWSNAARMLGLRDGDP
jgi:predicted TIM-barrel fold metal-dependent hydrolase